MIQKDEAYCFGGGETELKDLTRCFRQLNKLINFLIRLLISLTFLIL